MGIQFHMIYFKIKDQLTHKWSSLLQELSFSEQSSHNVQGRLSIADLFPKSMSRCGVYCFEKANGTYYIGQSVDVVKRFAQHCRNDDSISSIWFQAVSQSELNEREKHAIETAEKAGLPIRNKSLVSSILGETDLDYLVPPADQERWLRDSNAALADVPRLQIEEKYKLRFRDNFFLFRQMSCFNQLRKILTTYIENCILYPRTTEMSFWELSCLPNTNKSHHPRYFALNINFMEVFVAGFAVKDNAFWAFINSSEKAFRGNEEWEAILLSQDYRTLTYDNSRQYKAAGHDQVMFHIESLDELEKFITEDRLIRSAKEFNLRLMKKGATIYSRYHCFDLVDAILE